MEGTRLRILQLLQKNSTDTVEGLAGAIGLAPATIRRHLDILQRDSLVAFREVRKKTGRPEYSFYLTEEGQETLPKNYGLLLGELVRELADLTPTDTGGHSGTEILELLFQRLAGRVWDQRGKQLATSGVRSKLDAVVRLLSEDDFSPEAETVGDTLRIKLVNCPFRTVALKNSAVCAFDQRLISTMLDVDVRRQYSIHEGDACCMYEARLSLGDMQPLSTGGTA